MERIKNALLEELLENVADLGWSDIICQEPEGKEYAYTFDINVHVEKWILYRGQGGCPRDIRNLIENAEDIDSMIIELGRRVTVEAEKARLF